MPQFPDIDAFRKQQVKITDEETRAAFWLTADGFSQPDRLKAWALFTLAEHFRAGLATVTPDESQWPTDHSMVLADLEQIADAFAEVLFKQMGAAPGLPVGYPKR